MENTVDIQPKTVKAMLDAGQDFLFVDVREPEELLLATLQLKVRINAPSRVCFVCCGCRTLFFLCGV